MSTDKDQDQQRRTIEGQDSDPGPIWQESDKSQYTGYSDTNVGGSDPKGGASDDQDRAAEVNEQMDESQWQGSRFSQGGSGSSNS